MKRNTKTVLAGAFCTFTCAALGASARAEAPAYGSGRPVTVVVATTPGGGMDLNARVIADALDKAYPGTKFQVVNKPGAGNQVGIQSIADAKPDGYTFGVVPFPTTAAIYLDKDRKAQFDKKSFEPIATFVFDPGAIAVKADSPIKSLKDLVAAAKAKPGEITIGVSGTRNREHLDVIALSKASGAEFTPIFHNDSGLAVNSLLGGNITAVQGSVADFLAQVQAGRLRMLAVFSEKPSDFAPEVQTAAAQGYPLYSGVTRGFAFPKDTPRQYVEAVSDGIRNVTQDPVQQEKIRKMGFEIRYMGPDDFSKYWAKEEARVKELLAAAQ